MILCLPGGRVTFCCANIFILFLTTSMPLSLEAFSSWTPSLKDGPSSCLARHRMLVTLPSLPNTARRETVSWLPTISWNLVGRYFSIQGTFFTASFLVLLFSGSTSIFLS